MAEPLVQPSDVRHVAEVHLGPVTVLNDRSWPHGEAVVLEVQDQAGVVWVAKGNRIQWAYERERAALANWAPALGDRAPRLVASDDDTQTLIMTRLPGNAGTATTAHHHFQAGQLAARLHHLESQGAVTDYAATLHRQLDGWLDRVPDVVNSDDTAWVRTTIDKLTSLPDPVTTATHLDYQPRNWMLDDTDTLRVIDFGRARIDMLLRDFERLWFQEWVGQDDLRRAFFAGYGRDLNPDEESLIVIRGAYQAASTILWAREHDDPDFEAHGRRTLLGLRSDLR